MIFDLFALAATIILILLTPFMLFILIHTARRSGQDDWDRAEQARPQPLPKRPYTRRYIDALYWDPGPRRPLLPVSRSKRVRGKRTSVLRDVVAGDGSAVMRAVDGGVRQEREWVSVWDAQKLPPKMHDRFDPSNSRKQALTEGNKEWQEVTIDEIWFDPI